MRRLVFLDETWTKTNMTRLYGRSLRGTRLVGSAPHGHWNTTTFLAGLRHDGIVAPLMLDGPINGEAFLAWTERFLAPELRPGDIVVADRLGSHKGVAARQAIEARGAELMLLPSYSPPVSCVDGPVDARAFWCEAPRSGAVMCPASMCGTGDRRP